MSKRTATRAIADAFDSIVRPVAFKLTVNFALSKTRVSPFLSFPALFPAISYFSPFIVAARDGAAGEDRHDPRHGGGRR